MTENNNNGIRHVAYGPPGTNMQNLAVKEASSFTEEIELNAGEYTKERKSENCEENSNVIPKNYDTFDGLDSAVNIEITNKAYLKENVQNAQSEPVKSTILRKKLELLKYKQVEEAKNKSKEMRKSIEDSNTSEKDSSSEVSGISLSKAIQMKLELHKKRLEETSPHKENAINISNEIISLTDSSNETQSSIRSKILQKKLIAHRERTSKTRNISSSSDSRKDSSNIEGKKKDFDSDEESITEVLKQIDLQYPKKVSPKKDIDKRKDVISFVKNNVNPFNNVDPNISVFVDKLVTPVLMVHTKMNKRIQPSYELRDIPFNTHIHVVLKNMNIEKPMMIQSVTWFSVLRGYSLFMVSPLGSGKTIGYLPAVCRLISDFKSDLVNSFGPICIIVCGTAKSVAEVENLSKMFLGLEERVLSCYTGMDEVYLTSSLLNGCELLICTPPMLARLLQANDFAIDLRRLSTVVFEDCERLSEVYTNEVKLFLIKVKDMMKSRVNKELKVQYIAASRTWCDIIEPIAKKAPNSVICIGAFQECVLYSKASTSVKFVKTENKINAVLDFLDEIDGSKRTVIVCRTDDEVRVLEKVLVTLRKVVFACDNSMTLHDLYNMNKTWAEYQEPILGPILICCDGNLTHLNVTNAHYLVHFSLPNLFSRFCKRFAVLNDNYNSIFKDEKEDVKIKILLDDNNVEQLPKIMNFIKRCTTNIPESLDSVCDTILQEKDAVKATKLVPICDNLLALGECPDFWNCTERHAILKGYDEPKQWMPKSGIVTFKILHYQTAILYSARLLSNIVHGSVTKYQQNYSTLSLKLGMHFSKESNRRLHGIPKVGDICAVSVKQDFFVRCQVMKILSHYQKGNPNHVLIKLIDEEILEKSRDIYLYHLPDDLRNIETYVVQARLANVMPKDKDITFSDLARDQLKKITDKQDLYMRAHIKLTIGNCIFVDTLEACQSLTSLNETVVNEDFKKLLLDAHAVPNPDHTSKLNKLSQEGGLDVNAEMKVVSSKPVKVQATPSWAHLDDGMTLIVVANTLSPNTFFVRIHKFASCRKLLTKDIEKYVNAKPEAITQLRKGDIALAKNPDDRSYDRVRIDEVNGDKVKCFYVDEGEVVDANIKDLLSIPEKLITQLPFQAIECRLIGVQPLEEEWPEFAANWLDAVCGQDKYGDCRQFYIKYFIKEKAQYTEGNKYGVALVDTSKSYDVLINEFMVEANLGRENDEVKYFEQLQLVRKPRDSEVDECEFVDQNIIVEENGIIQNNTKDEKNRLTELSLEQKQEKTAQIEFTGTKDEEFEHLSTSPEIQMANDGLSSKLPSNAERAGVRGYDKYEMELSSDEDFDDFELVMGDAMQEFFVNMFETWKTDKEHSKADVPAIKEIEENSDVNSDIKETPNKTIILEDEAKSSSDKTVPAIKEIEENCDINSDIKENTNKIIILDDEAKSNRDKTVNENEINVTFNSKIAKELSECATEILDSDDLSSETTQNSELVKIDRVLEIKKTDVKELTDTIKESHNVTNLKDIEFHSDDFTSDCNIGIVSQSSNSKGKSETDMSDKSDAHNPKTNTQIHVTKHVIITNENCHDVVRTPQLTWRQNKTSVIIKIKLIGAESYVLEIGDRALKFETSVYDVRYAFDLEIYGVVDPKRSSHSNKGQYILVNLRKVLHRTWLMLTRDMCMKKWIVYDADFIDMSSDEEPVLKYPLGKATDDLSDSDSDIDVFDDSGY